MAILMPRWIRRPVLLTAVATLSVASGCSPAPADRTADMDAVQAKIARLTGQSEDSGERLAALAAAASRAPDDAPAQSRYAMALASAGRAQEALAVAEAAYKRGKDQMGLGLLLGRLHLQLDQGLAAAAAYQDVLKREPSNQQALNGLGIAEVLQGSLDTAEATFRRAVALAPAAVPSRNNLALALSLEHRTGESIPMLTGLLQEDGASRAVRTNLALAYVVSGDRAKAAEALKPVMAGSDIDKTLEGYASLAHPVGPVPALALNRASGAETALHVETAALRPVRAVALDMPVAAIGPVATETAERRPGPQVAAGDTTPAQP